MLIFPNRAYNSDLQVRKWAQRGLATCPRSHSQLKFLKPVDLTPKPEVCLPHKYEAGDVRVGRAAGAALAPPGCSGPCDPGERRAGARPTLSPYTWPQDAANMAHTKHPQMSLAYLTPPVLLENQECCLKQENLLPGFKRPLWGHRLWEQLD